jgi:hypothetical protein
MQIPPAKKTLKREGCRAIDVKHSAGGAEHVRVVSQAGHRKTPFFTDMILKPKRGSSHAPIAIRGLRRTFFIGTRKKD